MKKIYFATKMRGFFKYLSDEKSLEIVSDNEYFELNSKFKEKLSALYVKGYFDFLGIVKKNKVSNDNDASLIGSFNRFLDVQKPYFIYLENPTALTNYSIGVKDSLIGRKKIIKALEDENLKGIICMSNSCRDTFEEYFNFKFNEKKILTTIYPCVRENKFVTNETIVRNIKRDKIKCLYIARGVRFISKGGLEVLNSFNNLKDVELTIVTNLEYLKSNYKNFINKSKNISIIDFKMNCEEMEKLYSENSILIHPTSDDSCPLTVLEAMKAGMCIITTSMYAIPEMVEDRYNGFLMKPKYAFFDDRNMPNKVVWNNRKETIYNENKLSQDICLEIVKIMKVLQKDKNKLREMCFNSLEKSRSDNFNNKKIIEKWKTFYDQVVNKGN